MRQGVVHFGEMCMKPGKPSTFATVQRQRTRLFFGALDPFEKLNGDLNSS